MDFFQWHSASPILPDQSVASFLTSKLNVSELSDQDYQLCIATINGNRLEVEDAIQNEANINCNTILKYRNDTPLHLAVALGHIELVDFFIEKKAMFESKKLMPIAAKFNQVKTLNHLFNRLHPEFEDSLYQAAICAHVKVVEWLLQMYSVLHYSCDTELIECIRSNVGVKKLFSNNYIVQPEYAKRIETIVGLFIKHGADVNIKNGLCLYYAMLHGLVGVVHILLKHGASVSHIQKYTNCTVFESLLRGVRFYKSDNKTKLDKLAYYNNLKYVFRMASLLKRHSSKHSIIRIQHSGLQDVANQLNYDYARYNAWLLEKVAGVLIGEPYPDELKQLPKTMLFVKEIYGPLLGALDNAITAMGGTNYPLPTKKRVYKSLDQEFNFNTCADDKQNLDIKLETSFSYVMMHDIVARQEQVNCTLFDE